MVLRRAAKILLWVVLGATALFLVAAGVFYVRPEKVLEAAQGIGGHFAGIRDDDVQLGTHRIHFLTAGEGKPLVLVHGFGSRSESWLPLIPRFVKAHYKVYALDLLGNGKSDQPDVDYSISLQADVVKDFMASQKLAKADVCGWSMGGWISLMLASRYPDLVRRLVVFDGAGMRYQIPVDPAVLRPQTPAEFAKLMAILSPHPRPVPEFIARGILREMLKSDRVSARAMESMLSGKDLMDGHLGPVGMPVLLVWGKEDALTPLLVGEAMHREMVQSRLEIFDECGHLAPVECADRVFPEVEHFLLAEPPEPGGLQEFPAPVAVR